MCVYFVLFYKKTPYKNLLQRKLHFLIAAAAAAAFSWKYMEIAYIFWNNSMISLAAPRFVDFLYNQSIWCLKLPLKNNNSITNAYVSEFPCIIIIYSKKKQGEHFFCHHRISSMMIKSRHIRWVMSDNAILRREPNQGPIFSILQNFNVIQYNWAFTWTEENHAEVLCNFIFEYIYRIPSI